MKRLLPLLAALALPTAVNANWFGKYNSKAEAWEACNKWKNDQKIYSSYNEFHKNKRYSKFKEKYEKLNSQTFFTAKESDFLFKNNLRSIKEINKRYCTEERETKQILGYGVKALKGDIIYYSIDLLDDKKYSDYKILKYFKY